MAPSGAQTINIIGAGISGLALARCLQKRGYPFNILDRDESKPRHNYSVTITPDAYQPFLKELGLGFEDFEKSCALRDPLARGSNSTRDGEPVRVNRRALEGYLAQGVDVKWQHKVESVNDNSSEVVVNWAGAQPDEVVSGSLLVAADGQNSPLRRDALISRSQSEVQVAPIVAFNGRRVFSREQYEALGGAFDGVTYLDARVGNVLLRAYVNEFTSERVNVGWTFSRLQQGNQDPLHKPGRSAAGASEIPEGFYSELERLTSYMKTPFKTIFDPQAIRKERVLHWLMRSYMAPQSGLVECIDRKIIFIGESLHAMPIIESNGANLAIKDAIELANAFVRGSDLKEFYTTRWANWNDEVNAAVEDLIDRHRGASEKSAL